MDCGKSRRTLAVYQNFSPFSASSMTVRQGKATWAVSSTLLEHHAWHQVARLRVKRRRSQENPPAQHRVPLVLVQLRWVGYIARMEDIRMPKAVFFSELQEGNRDHGAWRNRTKTSWRNNLHRRESVICHGSRRPQTETADAHQWEKPVVGSRQKGMKQQRKDAGGRKSEQHP